jgi:hypothetical protein
MKMFLVNYSGGSEMLKETYIAKMKDVYLVCYEKPEQNCHRHLLMDIMHKRFGELRDTDKFIFFRSVLLPAIWSKSKGRKRNMKVLAINSSPKMRDADILVFVTPVYCDGITGPMKNLLDRTLPQVYPFFELRDGHCRHPLREDTKSSKVVLVSNCGFWEMDKGENAT